MNQPSHEKVSTDVPCSHPSNGEIQHGQDYTLIRSPWLMNADDTALIVVDVQEKLLPHIGEHELVLANIEKLLTAARILGVQTRITEQYPRGLGKTVPAVVQLLPTGSQVDPVEVAEKLMFSCRECEPLFASLSDRGIRRLLLCGIETHVCIAQTAMDMQASGFDVYLAVDAVGSRHQLDHQVALQRLSSCGCTLTTTEAAMFEWCERAGSDAFKKISKIVQGKPVEFDDPV